MNTFKNFIYNISDILVALLIIAAAVLIIGWRVNTIMDYPDKIAAVQTETKEDNAPKQTDTGSASETSPSGRTDERRCTDFRRSRYGDCIGRQKFRAGYDQCNAE